MATRVLETTIRYLGPCEGKPIFYGRRQELDNLPLEDRTVSVEDLRYRSGACSLDREGFTLTKHRTSIRDFLDPAMRRRYLRELEGLVQETTGAARVVAFTGGVIRRSERSPRFRKDGTTVPGRFAHCDFSPNPAGSRFWVERLLPPDEANVRLRRRFAIYTLWRVLSAPPQDTPLAVCDARSVGPHDQVCSDCVVDPADGPEFRFENSVFRYAPGHLWGYFSNMTGDEVLVFKGFDSDPGRAGAVPHAAFDDPSCPPGAPPRESIDERAVAFFDE